MTTSVQNTLFYGQFQEKTNMKDKSTLDKDAFLKLLITKMQTQDPLDPMNDEQMMTQMTQFSTVEQLTNLNKQFTALMKMQQLTALSSLIGREVEWVNGDQNGTAVVTSVRLNGDEYELVMDNGESVSSSQIIQINQLSSQ